MRELSSFQSKVSFPQSVNRKERASDDCNCGKCDCLATVKA